MGMGFAPTWLRPATLLHMTTLTTAYTVIHEQKKEIHY